MSGRSRAVKKYKGDEKYANGLFLVLCLALFVFLWSSLGAYFLVLSCLCHACSWLSCFLSCSPASCLGDLSYRPSFVLCLVVSLSYAVLCLIFSKQTSVSHVCFVLSLSSVVLRCLVAYLLSCRVSCHVKNKTCVCSRLLVQEKSH